MISALEEAVVNAGIALRNSPFGAALGRWNPGRRCALIGNQVSGDCTPLADAEVKLGMGPPIRRTFAAIQFAHLVEDQDIAKTDLDYMEWINRAHWAFQRVAGKCWAPLPQRLRLAVADVDDFGPLISAYIPASRENELGLALAFEGLDSPPVTTALQKVLETIRLTPVHEAAREVLQIAKADKMLVRKLELAKSTILERIRDSRPTIVELRQNARSILDEEYRTIDRSLFDISNRIRALNELVNHILWVLLFYADTSNEIPTLRENLGSVRVTQGKGMTQAHFTLWHDNASAFVLGHLPAAFEVSAGIPLDGLYLSTSHALQFSGLGLMDVQANRMAELERSPTGD